MAVIRHGLRYHPLYHIWRGILTRCLNEGSAKYPDYGGRGIKVCERWKESVLNFAADMGDRPTGFSIDRIDNNGDYEPGNCRWATKKQQSNNKRNVRIFELNGECRTLMEWADHTGINYHTLRLRMKSGLNLKQALDKKTNYNKTLCIGEDERTISEWSKAYGIDASVIRYRVRNGWDHEEAIKRPLVKGARIG